MDVGKLPAAILEPLLGKNIITDPRVVVGPKVGEDAAVVDMGDRYLVATCDPVTFAVDQIGWYAVQINANDIACSGAIPKWFLATLLLPEGSPQADAEGVFDPGPYPVALAIESPVRHRLHLCITANSLIESVSVYHRIDDSLLL